MVESLKAFPIPNYLDIGNFKVMPVTKQAIKKVRQDRRKTAINLRRKLVYKKAVHDFRRQPTEKTLNLVFKTLDRAAKTNVIHPNKAARLKSRLSRMIAPKSKTPKTTTAVPSAA
ncbi:30S ribosomal protein S20 [Candidatus Curtissbacteria bacterium]|nr:30S ribosomal protein S20 [Candidatus Curtissbacteria bacterium]